MNPKHIVISAALAASLTLGVGAALAQDNSTPNPPTELRGLRPNRPFRDQLPERLRDIRSLELAEEYTGLNIAEMREALQSGQSFADLITTNGQSVDAFVAAVMEQVTTRIDTAVENGRISAERGEQMTTQAQARITAWANGEPGPLAALLHEYTGLELPELREAHQNGQTLVEIITANGQSVDTFIASVMEPINLRIDTAVENGRISAERAAELKAQALDRITRRVNGEAGPGEENIAMLLGDL
jgi:polyhydroxyalkanoate synthesis regulator phasin